MKTNVLVLITSFLRFKGDDSFTFEYMKRVAKTGVEYDVIVPHDRENSLGFEVVEKIRMHRFQYFFPKAWQRIAYHGGAAYNISKNLSAKLQLPFFELSFLLKALRNAKGKDLIHAQWLPSTLVAVALKKLTGKPYVMWVQRMVFGKGLMRWLNFLALRNCDYVMFNSSYTQKEALKQFTPKRHGVLHIGIDLEKFKPMSKAAARKQLGLKKDEKIIFSLGRFVEKKGFEYLVEAMRDVKDKKAVCIIAGYGPLQPKLEAMIKEYGLDKRVKLIPRIQNEKVALWVNAVDVFTVPSILDSLGETETLGLVAVEAIACGRPVIASKVGGLVDSVIDNQTGFLVKEKDPKDLAEKINRLMANPGLIEKLGKNARKHAENEFAWPKIVAKTLDIYKQVLE